MDKFRVLWVFLHLFRLNPNIASYQVTGVVSNKTLEIRKIASRVTPGEGICATSEHLTPCMSQFNSEPVRVRAGARGGSLKHGGSSPWDGMLPHCSWYA